MGNEIRLIDANQTIEELAANFRQASVDGCDNPFYQIAEDDMMDGLEDDEVKEALKAAREDRSIIPPVRIGETIYHITTCKNFRQVLDGTLYGPDGGHGTATGYYCPCELNATCPFHLDGDDNGGFDCDDRKNKLAVFEDTVESILVSQTEEVMNFDYSGSADFSDFGRTVFRDYDKAKAALEAIKNGEND